MFPHSTITPDLSLLDRKIIPLVSFINKLGLPTFYSCEGHENKEIAQSFSPLVILSPSYTEIEALAFLRFVTMVGIHNNQKNLSITFEEKEIYVCWIFTPRGDETIQLSPKDHENYTLPMLHKGLETLVKNLEAIQK